MLNKNVAIIALVLAVVAGIYMWTRTQTQKLLKMADYKLVDLSFGQVKVLTTAMKVKMLISNPSDIAVKLGSFRVEIIRAVGADKKAMAVSPVTTLTIPAGANINYNIDFELSNMQLLSLARDLSSGADALKGKISILVKCTAMGQYIEHEIPYL